MNLIRSVIVAAVLAPALHAGSAFQSDAPLEPIKAVNWETLRTTVPVAGSVRTGVMTSNPGRFDRRERTLFVFLLQPAPPTLCLDVNSRDGRYTATRQFAVGGRQGIITLRLPTDHADALAEYEPGQLAILARVGNDCDGPTLFVVASWQRQWLGSTVSVFLNSRLPTVILAEGSGSTPEEIRCATLPEPTTAFNLQCDFPRAWLEGRKLNVVTRRGTNVTRLPLEFAPPKPAK